MNPLITVLMPVYNAEKHIEETIKSILNQTYKEFELLLIDDGCTDNTIKIIKKNRDERIKIIKNEKNIGLTKSLNKGIRLAKGKYIARMDSDDIMFKNRLKKQIEVLEKEKEIALVGSRAIFFYDDLKFIKKKSKKFKSQSEIRTELLFSNPIIHPSVMIRKSVLLKNNIFYDEALTNSQDHGLWVDLLLDNSFFILNETLINYRITATGVTAITKDKKKEPKKIIYSKLFKKLNISFTDEELGIHYEIDRMYGLKNYKYSLKEKEKWLSKLLISLKKLNLIEPKIFKPIFAKKYLEVCLTQGCYENYRSSIFFQEIKVTKFKFLLMSIYRDSLTFLKKLVKILRS